MGVHGRRAARRRPTWHLWRSETVDVLERAAEHPVLDVLLTKTPDREAVLSDTEHRPEEDDDPGQVRGGGEREPALDDVEPSISRSRKPRSTAKAISWGPRYGTSRRSRSMRTLLFRPRRSGNARARSAGATSLTHAHGRPLRGAVRRQGTRGSHRASSPSRSRARGCRRGAPRGRP